MQNGQFFLRSNFKNTHMHNTHTHERNIIQMKEINGKNMKENCSFEAKHSESNCTAMWLFLQIDVKIDSQPNRQQLYQVGEVGPRFNFTVGYQKNYMLKI